MKTDPIHCEWVAATSGGASADAILRHVAGIVHRRAAIHPTIIDAGCGCGHLYGWLRGSCRRYLGLDLVRYPGTPAAADFEFIRADLNQTPFPLPDGRGDVVVSVETIEHLENPRSFLRELYRLTRPGGLVIVTTPNQLSLLSKWTLVLKNQFNAFQEAPGLYPTHITALLECDLRRIAAEVGLMQIGITYTGHGRMPGVPLHWPPLAGGRAFSDNVVLHGYRRKDDATGKAEVC